MVGPLSQDHQAVYEHAVMPSLKDTDGKDNRMELILKVIRFVVIVRAVAIGYIMTGKRDQKIRHMNNCLAYFDESWRDLHKDIACGRDNCYNCLPGGIHRKNFFKDVGKINFKM